jgi:YHS domain-containing protein
MQDSKKQKDPVCGMDVDQKSATCKAHHKNKDYCFCCNECMKTFKNNPEKYSK